MFVHESSSHLWSNALTQLTLAWFCTVSRRRRQRQGRQKSATGSLGGHFEILLVYFCGGFGGGLAFRNIESRKGQDSAVGLVGSSAGVFALAGLCLCDTVADLWYLCWSRKGHRASTSQEDSDARWLLVLLLCARTLALTVVLAFDCVSFLKSQEGDKEGEVVLVHLAGLLSGVAVAVAYRLFSILRRLVHPYKEVGEAAEEEDREELRLMERV